MLHNGRVEKDNNQIQLFNDGSLIGNLQVVTIDNKIFSLVFRELDKFRTVSAHRLLRYLLFKAHKKNNVIELYNVLTFANRYSEIADKLSLKGERVIHGS